MSASVELQNLREVREPPLAKPLDEAVWQAWVAKGRALDLRRGEARVKALKLVTATTLLATVGLGSHLASYEVLVRFIVALGSFVMIFQAFHARRYAFAAVFGALVLLYNPFAPVFSFSGDWECVLLLASTLPFFASLVWRDVRRAHKPKVGGAASRSALTLLLVFGAISAVALAGDLSRYRDFQLGTDLPTVADQAAVHPSQAKVIHSRPALIQELEWRPRPLGWSSQPEPVQKVIFSFFDGELYRIVVDYDQYSTEGLTTDDMVEAISATYGMATKPNAPTDTAQGRNGDQKEVLARWQDPQYRFDMIRPSYGPSFRLIGVLRSLEAPAEAAILEATRLDKEEAPQRNAERLAREEETERVKLEKARLVNKPKFRP